MDMKLWGSSPIKWETFSVNMTLPANAVDANGNVKLSKITHAKTSDTS